MRPLATALITVSLMTGASGQTTPTDSAAEMQRPLKLPVLRANERCPITTGWTWRHPDYIFGGIDWFGDGPVYVTFAWGHGERASFSLTPIPLVAGMRRAKTPWAAEPSYSGPVVIRGRSADPEAAAAAGRHATSLGYSRVANLVQILPPPDDGALRRAAERELSVHRGLDGCRFMVQAKKGVVTIGGSVRHELQKDVAVSVVRNIDGVRAVESSLDRE